MTATRVPAHYVRHNKVTRVPRAHVYLDCEANSEGDHVQSSQTFRLAVAAFDRKRKTGDGWREREWGDFTDTTALWSWVDERCAPRARTVLVAHNLAYDLRIAETFTVLPTLGWSLKAIRLDGGQAWCSWRRDNRTLMMCDTLSWVPSALEHLGRLVDLPKLDLPAWADSDDTWFARCRRDVEILAEVWRRLLRWVGDDDLGNWKPTGAGQAWAAYRHRFMAHPLLVHDDDDARTAERAACHTGRCEAWRHGPLEHGPFVEWDYTTAYARIGAECAVPTQLVGEVERPTLARLQRLAVDHRVLVECDVTADVPTVPAKHDGRVVWPVGTFTTTLWDNEVGVALVDGATVTPRRAWVYRRHEALAAFCRWVLAGLDERARDRDPLVVVALKHWSRALIGRTAATWSKWETVGRSDVADVALSRCRDVAADERFDLLHVGFDLIRRGAHAENPDAMVAIMSWVMAECRVRLWRTMGVAGFDHVAYVDTDSLLVDRVGHERLGKARLAGLRVKGVWEHATVLGPRQIVLERKLRASGVPRGARQVEPDVWEGDVWSGLSSSLAIGQSDTVTVTSRRFRVRGTDSRRRHTVDGTTQPFRLDGV